MALSIGVHEKDIFWVQHTPVEVARLTGYSKATLRVQGRSFDIDDMQSVEILPKVFVSCGRPNDARIERYERMMQEYNAGLTAGLPGLVKPDELLPRLLIEAPRAITILRDELYKARPPATCRL